MKKQFIFGMIVAFAIVLLYVYRKKIFVAYAPPVKVDPTKDNKKVTMQALPGTEGDYIRQQIAASMLKQVQETRGTQDDSMLENERGKPNISQTNFAKNFDVSLLATNQVIRNDAARGEVCGCGCACGGGCGCPDQFDVM